jgi:hypothetical protein
LRFNKIYFSQFNKKININYCSIRINQLPVLAPSGSRGLRVATIVNNQKIVNNSATSEWKKEREGERENRFGILRISGIFKHV